MRQKGKGQGRRRDDDGDGSDGFGWGFTADGRPVDFNINTPVGMMEQETDDAQSFQGFVGTPTVIPDTFPTPTQLPSIYQIDQRLTGIEQRIYDLQANRQERQRNFSTNDLIPRPSAGAETPQLTGRQCQETLT